MPIFMNWKRIGQRFRFGIQYSPITLNCLLLAIAVFWCYEKLKVEKSVSDTPSSFAPLLILMSKTALWFLVALIAFCLLSSLLCYLHFLWLRKKKGLRLSLDFDSQKAAEKVNFRALLHSVRRPWLGAVRSRLVEDDGLLTTKLTLLDNYREKGHFFRKGITGKQALQLPDIKTYRLKGCFLYFEDLLHLFSFAVYLPEKGYFFQAPRSHRIKIQEERPQQVLQENVHVEESKRIQGDYLNYKNFEGGDDIRRIVWQVYAKNRELIVRIPEMRDFYASHLSFYASFHSGIAERQTNNAFAAEMLNYYKNCIWTAVETLIKKEIPVRFIPEQLLETAGIIEQQQQIQMILSNSSWQVDKSLIDYFSSRKKGILCISSLNDPLEIEQMLVATGRDTVVYFVPLSNAFHHWVSWGWVKRIFVKPPTDRLKQIRSRWPFSPLRYQLMRREKIILKLLDAHDVRYGILK